MIITDLIKNKNIKPYLDGFALPTILIASLIMMSVLMVSVTSTASIRTSLMSQYYNQLSQNAADAGVVYAKSCLEKNNNIPTWSDSTPLKPNTDCNGVQISGFTCVDNSISADSRCSVAVNTTDKIISTFSVKMPSLDSNGIAVNLSAVGTTNILRSSDDVVWRSYQKIAYSITRGIAISSISGVVGDIKRYETLSIGSVTPVEAIYNIKWQISLTTNPNDFQDIAGATNQTYYTIAADEGKYLRVVITGIGDYVGTATSPITTAVAFNEYINGRGVLTGKHVYYQDLGNGATYTWGPGSGCSGSGPHCLTGIDTYESGSPALVASNSVDFSSYPARKACKDIVPGGTGRLPYVYEIKEIYGNKPYYGNNFTGQYHWTATQYSGSAGYAWTPYNNGDMSASSKTSSNRVRCVFD